MPRFNLLDCTFRDGGYYTQWDFQPKIVSAYLQAVASSRIEALEIGFRFLPQDGFFGPFAYSSDEFLKTLKIPKQTRLAVMVNAKELLAHSRGPEAATDMLFTNSHRSPVQLVRIAAHYSEIASCKAIAVRLRKKGYQTAFNIMQAGGKSQEELSSAASTIAAWNAVDILYFADSLGDMTPASVSDTIGSIRRGWKGPIGVHAHNNMGQAVANSLEALKAGATWIDGTVLGMGRGAGNANIECLVLELSHKLRKNYSSDALVRLSLAEFSSLQAIHGWGPNALYYMSAQYGIHPTYVQDLMTKGQYDAAHLIESMKVLRNSDLRSYSPEKLAMVLSGASESQPTWSAKGWAKGRAVLLIAPGPSLAGHLDGLSQFVRRTKPVALSLNINSLFPAKLLCGYIACHRACIILDAKKYVAAGRPLIAPYGAVPEDLRPKLSPLPMLNYGLAIQKGTFNVLHDRCIIPSPVVTAYAFAFAEASGAKEILMAGFDGYTASNPLQTEMNHFLRAYRERPGALPLRAITPTNYDLPQTSTYSQL